MLSSSAKSTKQTEMVSSVNSRAEYLQEQDRQKDQKRGKEMVPHVLLGPRRVNDPFDGAVDESMKRVGFNLSCEGPEGRPDSLPELRAIPASGRSMPRLHIAFLLQQCENSRSFSSIRSASASPLRSWS